MGFSRAWLVSLARLIMGWEMLLLAVVVGEGLAVLCDARKENQDGGMEVGIGVGLIDGRMDRQVGFACGWVTRMR